MKIKSLFAALLVTTAFGVVSASAQSKIAIIGSDAFYDEKTGITKLINALKALNVKFQPKQQEITTMNNRLTTLAKEIDTLRSQSATAPIDQNALQKKVDEGEELQRKIKNQSEDAQTQYNKERAAALSPISQDIGNVLTEYAKKNGYTLVFDYSKDQAGFLITIGDDKADITTEFIAYYNARPATPAPK